VCGIAGHVGNRNLPVERLDSALESMCRRGPDAASWKHWELSSGRHVCLLHSRLSIIDLARRADQPIRSGGTWLSFNGELYNYIEVGNRLKRSGTRLLTESDSEVLAAVLDSEGADGLDGCEGMWAFAAFNEAAETVLLSRDRFGEKPLYLYRDIDGLYFASEIKTLMVLIGKRLAVNTDHLLRYMTHSYKSLYKKPHSFFVGVEELPPATTLRIDPYGSEHLDRYWTPKLAQQVDMTVEEAVAGTRDRLLHAVELRLRADVPMAFCMSGGIDSVSLISIAKRIFGYEVNGYTILNTDERYEELEMVEHAVSELGIGHRFLQLTTDGFISGLQTLIEYHDAPIYTLSYYVHWRLMEAIAADGYRISVSGTAADELFSGYFDHHLAYLYEVRNDRRAHQDALDGWNRNVRPVVRNPDLQNPRLFIDDSRFRDHLFHGSQQFRSFLHEDWSEPFNEFPYSDDLLRNRMLNEMFHETVPVILHEDDLNAMFFSVENRTPFLDRELFEFSQTIPTRYLIQDGLAKAILRKAMQGIAPDLILSNPRKVGFNVPLQSVLDTRDTASPGAALSNGPIFDFVKRESIDGLCDGRLLSNSESKFLFNVINANMFLELHG